MSRLKGRLVLSRIPKDLVQVGKNGEKFIWISVAERREVGQFGDTHTITVWDAENRKAIYIADLRPDEYENKNTETALTRAPAPAPTYTAVKEEEDYLPF